MGKLLYNLGYVLGKINGRRVIAFIVASTTGIIQMHMGTTIYSFAASIILYWVYCYVLGDYPND